MKKHKAWVGSLHISPKNSQVKFWPSICIFLLAIVLIFTEYLSFAQGMGEQAEMNRLEKQADDLISQDDPEGAAQAIGKAAMMAKIIGQQHEKVSAQSFFETLEKYFRGQEYAYRALAIFEQTGGHSPAPGGVCSLLEQAEDLMTESNVSLKPLKKLNESNEYSRQRYIAKMREWQEILLELEHDFRC